MASGLVPNTVSTRIIPARGCKRGAEVNRENAVLTVSMSL